MLRVLRLISYRQLRASWGRTLLVISGAATGVALIVAIDIVNGSILGAFRRTIDVVAGPAQLEITLGFGEVGFAESALEVARADPDVVAAVPLVRGTVSPARAAEETLQLFGADLVAEDQLGRYQVTQAGGRRAISAALTDPHMVLLTAAFAHRRGLRIGDPIELSTPRGVETFTIGGLLEPEGVAAAFGESLAVMDLATAQHVLAKDDLVDQIDVVVRSDASIADVGDRLRRALPGLAVGRPVQRGEQYERILASFQSMLTGLSLLCLVAGVFIVYNTTSTAVIHRAVPLAALRLAGADGPRLARLLVVEAIVLGAIGSLVGVPIGIALAWLLKGNVAESMGVIFQLRFPAQTLAVDVRTELLIALAGIGTTVFASSFAARRVTAMEPLAVLRSDAEAIRGTVPVRRLLAWWVVMLAASVVALVIEVRAQSSVWGNIGSTLWNSSVLVIAIPVVAGLATWLSNLLPRVFSAEGRMAAASLFRSPTRTGVTVAAVALVFTIGVTVSSLSYSHQTSVARYFNGGFLASDLVVSAVATEGGWLEAPVPEELAQEVTRVPGVRAADFFRVLPGQEFRGVRVAIAAGSDGFFEPSRFPAGWYVAGNAKDAGRAIQAGTGVDVSVNLADRFGLTVGQSIDLDSPTGTVTLAIVGIVPDYMSDRGSIIMNRRVLVERWNDRVVNRIHVFVENGASVEDVRRAIVDRVGARYRLKILSLGELVRYHDEYVRRAFALTDAIQMLVVIITIAGILDLLISSIAERRRELALWRVTGADDGAVRRSVMLESGIVGALGAVLGVAVGFVTAWIWVGINFRYLLGYYLEYHFAWTAAAWYLALVVVMTIVAGGVAASHATRQSILDGIRRD